jgi:hypothetical protein
VDQTEKLITAGLIITTLFYLTHYQETGRIWGKSDVDNYLHMSYEQQTGIALRHWLTLTIIRDLPTWTLTPLIPALYWLGNILPLYRLLGKNAVFCYIFATGSLSLCLTIGLWSQYLSLSLLLWAAHLYTQKKRIIPLILITLALTYLPTWYYIITQLLPLPYTILLTLTLMLHQPQDFWWLNNDWNPAYALLLMICPLLWIKLFYGPQRLNEKSQTLLFTYTLTRLSRALIYYLPQISNIQTTTLEKTIILAWFLISTICYTLY